MKQHLTRILKILIVMMYLVTILINFSNVFGFDVATEFSGTNGFDSSKVDPIKTTLGTVLDIIRFVGIGIALIIIINIGIKIMTAAPGERANIKQYSINYLIGAGILIGASGILTIIKNFTASTIKVKAG